MGLPIMTFICTHLWINIQGMVNAVLANVQKGKGEMKEEGMDRINFP